MKEFIKYFYELGMLGRMKRTGPYAAGIKDPETRIGDMNKIQARYIDYKGMEEKAWNNQIQNLPEDIRKELQNMFKEIKENKTKEAIIAKDADLLENAIQSKEYLEIGYKSMQDWIDNIKKRLKTETAKKRVKVMEKTHPEAWWKGIKKVYLDEKV